MKYASCNLGIVGCTLEGVWVQITGAPKHSFVHYFPGAVEAAPQGDTSPTK